MLDTDSRTRIIERTTLVGSVGNLALTAFKFVAGVLGHSAAMIADAVHSLSDLVTDVIVLVFVRLSGKPIDRTHDYGHGKYETLASAIIGVLLAAVGVGICINGIIDIVRVFSGESLAAPTAFALIAALVSIAVKEALYQYTVRVGRRLASPIVIANAWHHRSDAFSSIATTVGIAGAMLLGHQWRILDPLAAVLVSIFIVKVAIQLAKPAFDELLEQSLPDEVENRILQVAAATPGVTEPHNLRTRRVGRINVVDIHVRMPGDDTVEHSHAVTRHIEDDLRAFLGPDAIINIHVEPAHTPCPES